MPFYDNTPLSKILYLMYNYVYTSQNIETRVEVLSSMTPFLYYSRTLINFFIYLSLFKNPIRDSIKVYIYTRLSINIPYSTTNLVQW